MPVEVGPSFRIILCFYLSAIYKALHFLKCLQPLWPMVIMYMLPLWVIATIHGQAAPARKLGIGYSKKVTIWFISLWYNGDG